MKKIHEVCQLTGLTKKAIYYYIYKDLIHPMRDEDNDYYVFKEDDLERIQLIAKLRKLDIPINDISEILNYPPMLNFFLHRHLDRLRSQIEEELQVMDAVTNLIDVLPPNATPKQLKDYEITSNPNKVLDYYYPITDARMLTILFYGSFLKQPVDDYHMYLWTKITALFKKEIDTNLKYSKKLIYAIPASKINEITQKQYTMDMKIAHSNTANELIDILEHKLNELAESEELQNYWNMMYDLFLTPMFEFSFGPAQKFMMEYSEEYKQYIAIVMEASKQLETRLIDGDLQNLYSKLELKLPNHFNNHITSEINTILNFSNSIFTTLPLETIEEIIEDSK